MTVPTPPTSSMNRRVCATTVTMTQNLLLAARSLGLGATFTTWHLPSEAAVREAFPRVEERALGVTVDDLGRVQHRDMRAATVALCAPLAVEDHVVTPAARRGAVVAGEHRPQDTR